MLEYPFLRPAFFKALEDSGSVGPGSGWQAAHIEFDNGQVFMPNYVKSHSYGEYVFDWAWANAYHQHRLHYYPKLLSAIPFTPATGPRLRTATGTLDTDMARQAFAQIRDLAEQIDASGWHLLFPDSPTMNAFEGLGLMPRCGVQFHWFNRGYHCFDDFLAALASRKRKMLKRERRRIREQGLDVEIRAGTDIDTRLWDFFYRLYQSTYLKRSGGEGYLSREFFHLLGKNMAEQVAMAVAHHAGEMVACALYLTDSHTLYGRYWGCTREYDCLHFELCYYQGIEYAIALGLQRFDAGAQGEHKVIRGFEPVETHSLHWIREPRFAAAIAEFLERERRENQHYIGQAKTALPYKQDREK